MRKLISIVTVCFIITAMLSGCSALQKLGIGDDKDEKSQPASSVTISEEEALALSDKVPIHLYFANSDNTKLKLEVRYIPMSEASKSVNNLATIIVNELIAGPKDKNLNPTIPEGTKLCSPVSISGTIATVDLSKEFIDKHPGGKNAEQLTIYSIVNSLTEVKEINKVQFKIEGKVQSLYKGSYKFDVPFPRSTSLISIETTDDSTKDAMKQNSTSKSEGTGAQSSTRTVSTTGMTKKTDTTTIRSQDKMSNTDVYDEMSEDATNDDIEANYIETFEEAEAGEILE